MSTLQQYIKDLAYSIAPQPIERASIESFLSVVEEKLLNSFENELEQCISIGAYARETAIRYTIDKESDFDLLLLFKNENDLEGFNLKKEAIIKFISKNYTQSEEVTKDLKVQMKFGKVDLIPAVVSFQNDIPKLFIANKNKSSWVQKNPLTFDEFINKKNEESSFTLKPIIRLLKYWNISHGRYFTTESLEEFAANRISSVHSLQAEIVHILEQVPVLLKENIKSIRVLQELQELTPQLKQVVYKNDEYKSLFIFKQLFPPVY